MKTLTEHNAEVIRSDNALYQIPVDWHLTGIACDKCGAEMFNKRPRGQDITMDAGRRPRASIYCPLCGHEGFRYIG